MIDRDIRRMTRLLEALVRVQRMPLGELERRLDLGGGTLNRLFSGRIELKLRHVLLLLDAVGVKPLAFFRYAFQERPEEEEEGSEWVLGAVAELLDHGNPPVPPAPVNDLKRQVMQTLQELGILASGPPGQRGKPS
jgi:hypothetical protein